MLAPHLTNGKKMLKIRHQVPGIHYKILNLTLSICGAFLFTQCVLLFSSHNWNTLFLGTSAVADAIAEKYNTTKSQVLDHVSAHTSISAVSFTVAPIVSSSCANIGITDYNINLFGPCSILQESKGSVAVRMALGETQIVQETRQFLLDNSVCLDSFSQVWLI